MKHFALALLLASSLSLPPAARAQRETFAINPNASKISFFLSGNTHHVKGVFHVHSGSVQFSSAPGAISGIIIVEAGSGRSGNKSRDHNMDNNVLQTDQFPDITFLPKSYQGTLASTGDSTIQVSGIFTLRGASHNLTLPMHIHIEGSNLTATGSFTIPYVKWGLKDPIILFLKVAKVVDIDLTLAGTLSSPRSAK